MLADTTDETTTEHVPGQLAAGLDPEAYDDGPTMVLPVRILVLQRGWVVVGRYHERCDEDGHVVEVLVNDAQVIRRWGTRRGLGELIDGPKENTALDPAGIVRVHPLAVVLQIQANARAWQGHLK